MSTTIILPPLELLDQAAAHLVDLAADASHERALNKGLWNLQSGIEIRATTGGFLMPSGTRAGVIHRISHTFGCNCEAAAKGHICWHSAAIAILEEAQRYTRPTMPTYTPIPPYVLPSVPMDAQQDAQRIARKIAAARATAQLNELFA